MPVKGAGPACLQLDFSSLHIGLTEVKANGKMMVSTPKHKSGERNLSIESAVF